MSALALNVEFPESVLEELVSRIKQRVLDELGGESPPGGDRWMNAREAAAYLGYGSVSPLHKLTAGRRIPFTQDVEGGKLWFKRSELDDWRRSGGAG